MKTLRECFNVGMKKKVKLVNWKIVIANSSNSSEEIGVVSFFRALIIMGTSK